MKSILLKNSAIKTCLVFLSFTLLLTAKSHGSEEDRLDILCGWRPGLNIIEEASYRRKECPDADKIAIYVRAFEIASAVDGSIQGADIYENLSGFNRDFAKKVADKIIKYSWEYIRKNDFDIKEIKSSGFYGLPSDEDSDIYVYVNVYISIKDGSRKITTIYEGKSKWSKLFDNYLYNIIFLDEMDDGKAIDEISKKVAEDIVLKKIIGKNKE